MIFWRLFFPHPQKSGRFFQSVSYLQYYDIIVHLISNKHIWNITMNVLTKLQFFSSSFPSECFLALLYNVVTVSELYQ